MKRACWEVVHLPPPRRVPPCHAAHVGPHEQETHDERQQEPTGDAELPEARRTRQRAPGARRCLARGAERGRRRLWLEKSKLAPQADAHLANDARGPEAACVGLEPDGAAALLRDQVGLEEPAAQLRVRRQLQPLGGCSASRGGRAGWGGNTARRG